MLLSLLARARQLEQHVNHLHRQVGRLGRSRRLDQSDAHELQQRRCRDRRPAAHERRLGVLDVPPLRRDRDALAVARAPHAVQPHRLLRRRALARPHHVHADHRARAALAGLAVHDPDVLRVEPEPRLERAAEGRDQREWRRVVVVRAVPLHALGGQPEDGGAVDPVGLHAQVVHLAVARVVLVHEGAQARRRIAVRRLHAGRGETCRDDAVVGVSVREVEVEAVLDEATLLLGDEVAHVVQEVDSRLGLLGGAVRHVQRHFVTCPGPLPTGPGRGLCIPF